MSKLECFWIEGSVLYLEQVLVDYMDIPIFFVCSDCNQHYIALCTDIKDYNYIVVAVTETDIYNMFQKKISMRDIILKQEEFWKVESAEKIYDDTVIKLPITKIDYSNLPKENANYEILTDEVKRYAVELENNLLKTDFSEINNSGIGIDSYYETVDNYQVDMVVELGSCKVDVLCENCGIEYNEQFNRLMEYYIGISQEGNLLNHDVIVFKAA